MRVALAKVEFVLTRTDPQLQEILGAQCGAVIVQVQPGESWSRDRWEPMVRQEARQVAGRFLADAFPRTKVRSLEVTAVELQPVAGVVFCVMVKDAI